MGRELGVYWEHWDGSTGGTLKGTGEQLSMHWRHSGAPQVGKGGREALGALRLCHWEVARETLRGIGSIGESPMSQQIPLPSRGTRGGASVGALRDPEVGKMAGHGGTLGALGGIGTHRCRSGHRPSPARRRGWRSRGR